MGYELSASPFRAAAGIGSACGFLDTRRKKKGTPACRCAAPLVLCQVMHWLCLIAVRKALLLSDPFDSPSGCPQWEVP
jgi:hypothetical protein